MSLTTEQQAVRDYVADVVANYKTREEDSGDSIVLVNAVAGS